MSQLSAPPPQPTAGDQGLASAAPEYAAEAIRRSWNEFSMWWDHTHPDGTLDLDVARTVVGRLGSWSGQRTMADLIAESCEGSEITDNSSPNAVPPPDATFADISAALSGTRTAIIDWLDRSDWQHTALAPAATPLGRLPLLTALHGTAHQLAVAQMALLGDPALASPTLVMAGVVATCDTMGAFAARTDVRGSLALVTPTDVIATWAEAGNWCTFMGSSLPPGYRGPALSQR